MVLVPFYYPTFTLTFQIKTSISIVKKRKRKSPSDFLTYTVTQYKNHRKQQATYQCITMQTVENNVQNTYFINEYMSNFLHLLFIKYIFQIIWKSWRHILVSFPSHLKDLCSVRIFF